jgi:tRNA pseudouridine38-40 synthase
MSTPSEPAGSATPAEMPALHGVCLRIAYDGSDFAGYQRQPGQRTVQGELERAAARMTGHPVEVRGAGRTDSGVHALGQVVAFDSERHIPPKGFRLGLNGELPDDVRVHDAWPVAPGYNPRFDALGKLYRYVVQLGEQQNPLLRARAWQLGKVSELDLVAMRRAARLLEGTHDYRAFRAADDDRENTVRTLHRIDVRERFQDDPTLVAIEVQGTAFMKNMVRILAGTLVSVGRGRLAAEGVTTLLGESAVRSPPQQTAPAHGLTLVEVYLGRQAAGG